MNGILGLNCRVLGVSRDMIMSAAKQIGGAFILIQDDAELVPIAKAAGFRTIYRQSDDETLSLDPATFVQTRAEKGADYTYLTNEIDPTPELLDWTRRAIDYATPRGIRLCVFNFSTDRSAAQWNASAELCLYAARRNHAIGLHVYQRNDQDSSVHNWLSHKQSVGGLWLVTEYAWYVDAYHGWRSQLSPWQYSAFLDKTLPLFQREQMPVLCFSGDNWPSNDQGKASGFGVLDSADMLGELARVNTKYSWTGISVITTLPDGTSPAPKLIDVSAGLKLRSAPALSSTTSRILKYHERVTVYGDPVELADSYSWQRLTDSAGLAGWSANWVDGEPSWVDLAAVDVPHFSVPFTFYSQLGADANLRNNDCLPASCRMLLGFEYARKGIGDPSLLTVNDMTMKTPLATADKPLSINDGLALLAGYGIKATYQRPLDRMAIAQEIQAGRPCVILCNYRYINPAQTSDLGHFAVVRAIGERGVWLADPYLLGDNAYVTNEALDKALSQLGSIAAFANQGICLIS